MKALILAGGFSTRLRPLSCTRPKILFPLVNKPLLQWTLERLADNKIKEVVLAVNYQTEMLIEQARIPKNNMHITYSQDPPKKPLGTGGPIRNAEKLLSHGESFLALNGDIFCDVNYTEILKIHEEKKAWATIALHRVEDPSRYGVAELTTKNCITRFVEKPPRNSAPTNLVNAGAYVLSPKIFDYIPQGRKVSLEREVFPKLADEGKLYGHVFDGMWMDIGKSEDYLKANRILLDLFTTNYMNEVESGTEVKDPVAFDKGVSVGEKSVVGPYVVLGRNVVAGKNVHIQNSVIFPGTEVSDLSSIDGAIIGENVVVGRGVRIREKCVIGDNVRIRDDVLLAEEVLICPGKEISRNVLRPKCIL